MSYFSQKNDATYLGKKKEKLVKVCFPIIIYLRIRIRNVDPDPWTQMNADTTGSTSLVTGVWGFRDIYYTSEWIFA